MKFSYNEWDDKKLHFGCLWDQPCKDRELASLFRSLNGVLHTCWRSVYYRPSTGRNVRMVVPMTRPAWWSSSLSLTQWGRYICSSQPQPSLVNTHDFMFYHFLQYQFSACIPARSFFSLSLHVSPPELFTTLWSPKAEDWSHTFYENDQCWGLRDHPENPLNSLFSEQP